MMVFIDYLNTFTRGGPTRFMKGSHWRQYLLASFLGVIPGCLGAFTPNHKRPPRPFKERTEVSPWFGVYSSFSLYEGSFNSGGINFGNGCYTFYSSRSKIFQPSEFVKHNLIYVLFLAGLIGIIPESGPHMIFVMMFYKKVIPFSVFFTSCIIQDGYGMLPLLSHSVRVSFWVKMVNLVVGITIGYFLYRMGI